MTVAIGGQFHVPGFRLGHWTHDTAKTGCTVVVADALVPAAVDVRGGAPGTRETDLLSAGKSVGRLDAAVLTGGSAFGLACADGVMALLQEQGRGYPTPVAPVPIVAGAVIFDLVSNNITWPAASAGYEAASTASEEWSGGSIGGGRGASVSKILGREHAIPTGVGVAQVNCSAGLVTAVFVNNAFGDVVSPETGKPVTTPGRGDRSSVDVLLDTSPPASESSNTVIGAITVSRPLDQDSLNRIAVSGQAGVAVAIRPAHTPADGDTVFALSTGEGTCTPQELMQLTTAAQQAAIHAIVSTVRQ